MLMSNGRPDFYNPIYYSIIKNQFFRFQFQGIEGIQINHSQLHQDLFVLCILNGKRHGTYLEIGAHEPIFISNTYLLEQHFNWTGIGIELDEAMANRHRQLRQNPCLQKDALLVDYDSLLAEMAMPSVIDYLSVDIDPPRNSLNALLRLPHDRYRFRVITFEHDYSHGGITERRVSREFLASLGYQLVVNDVSWGTHIVEDWWVEPQLIASDILASMTPPEQDYHPHDQYFYPVTQVAVAASVHQQRASDEPPTYELCVEGWRNLNHSYSLVNQWQLSELLRYPIQIRHRDVAPYRSHWNPQSNASGIPTDTMQRIQQVQEPKSSDSFEAIYRISFPINLADGPGKQLYVFGTSEMGNCEGMFVGATPSDACKRGNLRIITPSHWSKTGFARAGFPDKLIHVIPHGVAPSSFFPVAPDLRTFYREIFGFRPEDFVMLNLGAMTSNKGVDLFLLAYSALERKHQNLKIVIKDQSNLYGVTLHDVLAQMESTGQAATLNSDSMEDIITISDNLDIEALNALYNACDVYVSPYRAEGFNLPPLEAAACGLPIIVTSGGATDDYFHPDLGMQIDSRIQEEGNRIILEPDLDSLMDAIEQMIENPMKWGGRAGSQFVHQNFSWSRITDILLKEFGILQAKN